MDQSRMGLFLDDRTSHSIKQINIELDWLSQRLFGGIFNTVNRKETWGLLSPHDETVFVKVRRVTRIQMITAPETKNVASS